MAKRYFVVDQNILRKPSLETLLLTDSEVHCVLPDLALLEMTKRPQWEATLRGSLAILARFPSRAHVCLSVNEGMARELETIRSISGHLMFHQATVLLRDILESVRTGNDGDTMRRIRQDLPRHLPELSVDFLSHEDNKKGLKELIETTEQMVPEELQKRMRKGSVSDFERLDTIHAIGTSLLPSILADRGITMPKARSFMKRKPLLLRYLYLTLWRCLRWMQNRGFESFPAEKVTNQDIDNQYILGATFFHGLFSEETDANDAYKDLRLLLSKKI